MLNTCPPLIVDTSRTAALASGPAVAGIERTLMKASFLVKGSTPDARAAKMYGKYCKSRSLDPLGKVVALPFDGSFAYPVDTVTDTRESCGTLEDIEDLAQLIGSLMDPSSLTPSSQPPEERIWLITLTDMSKDGWVPLEAFLYLPEVNDFFESRGIVGQSCFACLVAAACRSSRLRLDMHCDEPRVRLDGKRKEPSQAQVERRELNSFEPYQLVGGRVLAVASTGKSQDCLLVDIGASIPCSIHVHNADDFSPGVWLQDLILEEVQCGETPVLFGRHLPPFPWRLPLPGESMDGVVRKIEEQAAIVDVGKVLQQAIVPRRFWRRQLKVGDQLSLRVLGLHGRDVTLREVHPE
ncbi:unnamed protein product, partial [Symbiodinium sp. CCMP2592]